MTSNFFGGATPYLVGIIIACASIAMVLWYKKRKIKKESEEAEDKRLLGESIGKKSKTLGSMLTPRKRNPVDEIEEEPIQEEKPKQDSLVGLIEKLAESQKTIIERLDRMEGDKKKVDAPTLNEYLKSFQKELDCSSVRFELKLLGAEKLVVAGREIEVVGIIIEPLQTAAPKIVSDTKEGV